MKSSLSKKRSGNASAGRSDASQALAAYPSPLQLIQDGPDTGAQYHAHDQIMHSANLVQLHASPHDALPTTQLSSRAAGIRTSPEVVLSLSPGKVQQNESSAHAAPAVVQAFGLANVVLEEDPESRMPYVANINFKERVPTTSAAGQGDHTVAEALIEAAIRSIVGNGIPAYLEKLQALMGRNLAGDESAHHTDEASEKRYPINANGVYEEISTAMAMIDDLAPYQLAGYLSDLTTKVWRLLSKRDLTAFERKDGWTTGGGGGAGEAAAMREIQALEVPDRGWNERPFIDRVATILRGLIDFNLDTMDIDDQRVICRRAAEHVGDVLGIRSSDWKNRVAVSVLNQKHDRPGDGRREAPAPAPEMMSSAYAASAMRQ